jgi:hypothetical protein
MLSAHCVYCTFVYSLKKKDKSPRGNMRTLIAVALAATLAASSAMAADNVGPLAPGKPAGVKQAELGTTTWALIGVGVLAAVIVGVASGSNGSPLQASAQQAVVTSTASTS